MSMHQYTDEELNFFKFASIVFKEFPNALRSIFEDMWNTRVAPSSTVWDDSPPVRNKLQGDVAAKLPMNEPFEKWDCTSLFQATLYARTFALPDSTGKKKTLGEMYLKGRKPVPGPFHSAVRSSSGDANETIALAIDQLRLLRNTLCHTSSPQINKVTFDDYVKHAKDAFTALNFSTTSLERIGNLKESDFPTREVEKLNEEINRQSKVIDEISGIKDGMSEMKDEVSEMKDEVSEVKDEMSEMKDEMTGMKDGISGIKDGMKDEMRSIKGDTTELQDDVREIKCKISGVEHEVKSINGKLTQTKETTDQCTRTSDSKFKEFNDVLLMTVDDTEFNETQNILENVEMHSKKDESDKNRCFGEIGKNKVTLLKVPNFGKTGASSGHDVLVYDTIQELKPKAIVSLGVCDGVRKEAHFLGDVVVSSQVYFLEQQDDGLPNFDRTTYSCNLGLVHLFDRGKFAWVGPCENGIDPKVHIGQFMTGLLQDGDDKKRDSHKAGTIGVDTAAKRTGIPMRAIEAISS